MERRVFSVLRSCVSEYNRYHSPEARVEIIEIWKNKVILKFSGHYCFTCGVYDYFEDLVHLLDERGINSKIVKVYEDGEGDIVEIEISTGKNLVKK